MAVTAKGYISRLARWLWPGGPSDDTGLALAWTAASLGVLAPIVELVPVGPVVRALAVVLFICLGPGSAVVCRFRLGDGVAAWALTLVLSLATMAGTAALMAWLRWWHPMVGFDLIGAAITAACAPLLVRRRWWPEPGPLVSGPLESTMVLPRIADPTPDSTIVMPRIPGEATPTETAVIPAIREDDWTTAPWRRSPGTGWPAGAGAQATAGGWPDNRTDRSTRETVQPNGWAAAEGRAADETAVLGRVEDGRWPSSPPASSWFTPATREVRPPAQALPEPSQTPAAMPSQTPAPMLSRALAAMPSWRARWLTRRNVLDAFLLLAVLALWLVGVASSSTAGVGDYGLLSVMHPTFFAAIGLCVAGFVVEMYRHDWRWPVLLGYLVLLLLILHATVPLMVHEPEYAWTYKHIGVIEYIRLHGAIDDPKDIYLQWPPLFALGAQVVAVSGVSGLRFAAWAPLFFDTLNCLPLFAIARTLSSDRRMPFLTVFLFTAINWVAQDYLSPQAFTYVLCLGTFLIMLRWLRRVPGTTQRRPPRQVLRLWAWLHSGLVEVPYTSTRSRNLALGTLYVVYAVVVASHQLSPYVVALGATGLVVLGLIQPIRIVPILLGIALLYLLPRRQVADNYGLFNGLNFFHNAQGTGPMLGTTAGRVFSAHVVELLALEIWGLAALAVLESRRRLGPVAVPAVLGFAPFALLMAQSYGGEAIYRVYLFTVPWCTYLIARMVLRWRWMPRAVGMPVGAVVLTAAVLACIQGEHGQLVFDQFSPAEVQAATYIYTHAPPHSSIVTAIDNFPTRLTAEYPTFQGGPNNDLNLVDYADLTGHPLTDADLPKIDARFQALGPDPAFLVISPSMVHFSHFFGYLPDGAMDTLRHTVGNSPNFTVYYQNRDVVIYRYLP